MLREAKVRNFGEEQHAVRGFRLSDFRSNPCIITFMGPVGVGKSTHMRLLREYLKLNNVRVTTTLIKSSHGLTYILNKFLIASSSYEKISSSGYLVRIYSRKEILKRLYPLYVLLDSLSIASKFFFSVYLPFSLGFTVLIEEGLLMTLYTYRVSFPEFFGTKAKVLPLIPYLLGYVMSRNHIDIVLDASIEELDRRRKSRDYRQSELVEYVEMQKKWMTRLGPNKTYFIDTTDLPAMKVHRKIMATLENTCRNLR